MVAQGTCKVSPHTGVVLRTYGVELQPGAVLKTSSPFLFFFKKLKSPAKNYNITAANRSVRHPRRREKKKNFMT